MTGTYKLTDAEITEAVRNYLYDEKKIDAQLATVGFVDEAGDELTGVRVVVNVEEVKHL